MGYLVPGHVGPGLRQMSRVVGKPPGAAALLKIGLSASKIHWLVLIERLPGWLSSLQIWLSDSQDGCPVEWFDWVTARMAGSQNRLFPVFPGPWRHWGPIICGGTARYGHWGPFNMRWDRQIWTLRSNFRLWGTNLRALRSKIWTWKIQKWVLRSKNGLLRGFPRPKWLLKIFWNIPGSSRLDFI